MVERGNTKHLHNKYADRDRDGTHSQPDYRKAGEVHQVRIRRASESVTNGFD